MKAFYVVMMLIFLTSCGSNPSIGGPEPEVNPNIEAAEQIEKELSNLPDDIDNDTDSLWSVDFMKTEEIENETVMQGEQKVIELSTQYVNPAGGVDVSISYELSSDNTITSILVTSPNYSGMRKYNDNLQNVIGMSVEEASEYYISGSSLFTPAFQAAMKSSI